jgi:hypothetical protein
VTAQVRLANNVIKGSPGFSIFVPGDLHTINLEDFPPSATIFIFNESISNSDKVFVFKLKLRFVRFDVKKEPCT